MSLMFEGVKECKVSDYLMFDGDLKGNEYAGEIDFDNGYGLSIVSHKSSYGGDRGLFEIMLVRNGQPCSFPPITQEGDTVKGFLTKEEVEDIIDTTRNLPGTV
jgi:hypothetical protein